MRPIPEESDDEAFDIDTHEEEDRPRPEQVTSKSEEGPACQACRRKKAKCSRGRPCSHCNQYKLDCIYDGKRSRPGMRTGAIELLNQRVLTLENMFLGQGILWQQVWHCLEAVTQDVGRVSGVSRTPETLAERTAKLKQLLSTLQADSDSSPSNQMEPPSKRRRAEGEEMPQKQDQYFWTKDGQLALPDDLVDALVQIYFARIQPWIPILHVVRFQEGLKSPQERRKNRSIFHAITSLCVRFSDDPRLADSRTRTQLARECRQLVILDSMESFSVESLQALIICAFDTIGSGRGPSAWSIVGSMARTVEQLQLNTEDEEQYTRESKAFITRIAFLPPSLDWAEAEERRRVFWNVFLMDRFCSIATGWNLSLKSAEVKRRLPCEGTLWRIGEPLSFPTPYFGVSEQANPTEESVLNVIPGADDSSSLGGLSYCIEATESLSLVTSFFLRQVIDVNDTQSIRLWLLRFKQLDLRLVQWKIFLPERWREACARNADGNMDPNLTLAHLTHNTAVVLLHQGVAYPSSDWQSLPIRLPSTSSADTCLTAAREVAIIAEKFLQDADFLTNPQFAFCLFICGRMLLAHSTYFSVDLDSEVDMLVNSLQEVSRRWNGPHIMPSTRSTSDNLAGKFACRLLQARQVGSSALDITQTAYSEDQIRYNSISSTSATATTRYPNITNDNKAVPGYCNQKFAMHANNWNRSGASNTALSGDQDASPDSITMAFPPLPIAFRAPSAPTTSLHTPNTTMNNKIAQGGALQFDSLTGLEDLNSFFTYPFLPDQRVSMFLQAMEPQSTDMAENQDELNSTL